MQAKRRNPKPLPNGSRGGGDKKKILRVVENKYPNRNKFLKEKRISAKLARSRRGKVGGKFSGSETLESREVGRKPFQQHLKNS